MNEQLYAQAEILARQNYDVVIETDILTTGQRVFLGMNPELPGCMTQVDNMVDMNAMLLDARTLYIYGLLEDELPVPTTQANLIQWRIPFEAMMV